MKKSVVLLLAVVAFSALVLCCACTQVKSGDESDNQTSYYTVTFYDDGEAIFYENVSLYGYAINITPPEKYGYDFDCWLYNGAEYDFTTPVTYDFSLEASRSLSQWTVTFVADGVTVSEFNYTYLTTQSGVTIPEIPEKPGYTAVWESFSLCQSDITVNAVYTAIEYNATFIADTQVIDVVTFTVEDGELCTPDIPEITGFEGSWNEYEIIADDMIIYAVYTAKTYTVNFYIGDTLAETITYKYGTETVTEPDIPEVTGYTAAWEDYNLNEQEEIDVHAEYTPKTYSVNFYFENILIGTVYYKYGTEEIEEPSVPLMSGYDGAWADYKLNEQEEIDVYAEYTLKSSSGGSTDAGSGSGESGSGSGDDSGEPVQTSESILNFTQVSGGYEVTGLKSGEDPTEIVIPATYDGMNVVSIGEKAFSGNTTLSKITMLGNIKTICKYAFLGCFSLIEVNMPSTVETIGECAFADCALYSITLPDSLITISKQAFYCSNIKELVVPDNAEYIGDMAFYDCSFLEKITIGKSVNYIGTEAFSRCVKLTSVVFLDAVGWKWKNTPESTSAIDIDVSNPSTAAYYMTNDYYTEKYFFKG